MKKIILFNVVVLIFSSCSKKIASYNLKIQGKEIKYKLILPQKSKLKIDIYEGETVKTYSFPDSSSVYFSDNVAPSAFYPDAYKKYGKDLNVNFLINDSITINGIDEKGRYWEERKIKNIVYGYRKVPGGKKRIFDDILNSIEIKER